MLALFTGQMDGGRLVLASGKFGNPNDLAQILLIGLPFWFAIAGDSTAGMAKKLAAAATTVLILGNLARTGSRGGMITFGVLALVVLARASMGQRFMVMAGLAALALLAAIFMPSDLRQRYFTFRAPGESDAVSEESGSLERATSSTESRLALLKDSVTLTMQHPLLGVGPGQFKVAQNELAVARGERKGQWLLTHNTFTEWSSENGLPALAMIVAVLAYAWRAASPPKLRGPAPPQMADMSRTLLALKMALLAYIVSAMFASTAYQPHLPVLAGLAVAFSRSVQQRLAAAAAGAAASTGRPVPAASGMFAFPRTASSRPVLQK
jgi:O-antigen ligase